MTTVATTRYGVPSLLVFVVLVAMAASFGTWFRADTWFAALSKPAWMPPKELFGPVWTALYLIITAAGWRLWRSTGRMVTALHLWGAQLVLNALWPFMFFGLHRIDIALGAICLQLALILSFIATAWRYSRFTSWLCVPYAAWVGFAASLNFAIWRLNST